MAPNPSLSLSHGRSSQRSRKASSFRLLSHSIFLRPNLLFPQTLSSLLLPRRNPRRRHNPRAQTQQIPQIHNRRWHRLHSLHPLAQPPHLPYFSRRSPPDVRLIATVADRFASQIQLGVVARVRGKITAYRGSVQITVSDIVVERDPNVEILHWLIVLLARKCYDVVKHNPL
ncbi:CST complex subunit STN1 [Camellia lanceoleosa]|uniref:CST complex subunit STN1 n=1 Tax=Camellia lanceoleosa TaxID=1840588 RepID=A0ACC0FS96_9ERIC|nr:CST complex subunit STN1 [Camellia lanceoleosa]